MPNICNLYNSLENKENIIEVLLNRRIEVEGTNIRKRPMREFNLGRHIPSVKKDMCKKFSEQKIKEEFL